MLVFAPGYLGIILLLMRFPPSRDFILRIFSVDEGHPKVFIFLDVVDKITMTLIFDQGL